jgi:PKHD-type hydroxylase
LFFAHPDEYESGELVVEDTYGTDICSFFWIQSMIRDNGQRTLLFDLDMAIQSLNRDMADHPSAVQFTGVYHNLLRQWADL